METKLGQFIRLGLALDISIVNCPNFVTIFAKFDFFFKLLLRISLVIPRLSFSRIH